MQLIQTNIKRNKFFANFGFFNIHLHDCVESACAVFPAFLGKGNFEMTINIKESV